MIKQKFIVNCETGLHARVAAIICAAVSDIEAKMIAKKTNGDIANVKSLLNFISLNLKAKDEFVVEVEGDDEKKAIDKLTNIFSLNNIIPV